jgi:hypothetical protein
MSAWLDIVHTAYPSLRAACYTSRTSEALSNTATDVKNQVMKLWKRSKHKHL